MSPRQCVTGTLGRNTYIAANVKLAMVRLSCCKMPMPFDISTRAGNQHDAELVSRILCFPSSDPSTLPRNYRCPQASSDVRPLLRIAQEYYAHVSLLQDAQELKQNLPCNLHSVRLALPADQGQEFLARNSMCSSPNLVLS